MAGGLAGRYATALFELADGQGALDAVDNDLRQVETLVADNPDLARSLQSPAVSRKEGEAVVAGVADKAGLSPLSRNFLGVLAAHGRLGELGPVTRQFGVMLAERRGQATAEVSSAQPLSEEQVAKLRESVARYVGREVHLQATVDPDLIGGLVVRVGSRMIDASLKTKLQHLEQSMRGIG